MGIPVDGVGSPKDLIGQNPKLKHGLLAEVQRGGPSVSLG
jgi:hypothetical protein